MRKSHDERKSEIIEAALEVAADQGVGRATTQAIADRVGIAQPTVFRHFRTRDAIFEAAIGWVGEALFKALSGLFQGEAPPDERLRELIRRQLGFISQRRGIPRLLFSDRLHLENPGLRRAVMRLMERYTERVSGLLREGIREGRFRADLDPDETARLLISLVQGLVARWSLSDFAFDLESEGEPLWRLLWRGMAPE